MFRNFFKDESGQGMVEYALIIALVAILLVGGLTLVKNAINGKFTEISTTLGGSSTSGTSGSGS